jgi:hypothetical protein
MSRVILALCALFACSGCALQSAAVDADAVADADVSKTYGFLCQKPLSELTKFPLTATVDDAKAAAQKQCKGAWSAASTACADGGVAVYYSTGRVSEIWWFDASGKLIGYQWNTDNGFVTGCNANRWGTFGACSETPINDAARVSLCPTPSDASDTSDSGPDSVDTGADIVDSGADTEDSGTETSPDIAIDVAIENTVCSSQTDCAADKWCSYTGCGFTTGQCLPKPSDCTGQYSPICGCDSHSYDSACHAQKAGKAIAAYSAPCLGSSCTPACASGATCVDCASGGVQCLTPGQKCVGGK